MAGFSSPMPLLDYSIQTIPTNTPDQFSFKDATFDEVLEDLLSRFILNLPEDELAEVERVCFQIEQAHWYYEDFIREEKPSFPSLPLKKFSEILFHSCPLLHRWSHDHESAFSDFMEYKTRVPVCGAIMLNESLTKCVLVKGWKASAGWGFPKGKVNENEDEAYCAVREVLEETGFNLSGKIQRQHRIDLSVKQQPVTLFVVPGIPEDFVFRTQTRKEISKIDWFKLADLPGWKKNTASTTNHKFYLIAPVIHPLKSIVRELRMERREAKHRVNSLDTTLSNNDKGPSTSGSEESPVSMDSISHVSCAEADVSSSQSSSVDPHTPLSRGDLGPFGFDPDTFRRESFNETIATDSDKSISYVNSVSSDNGSHWGRLMTRLSDSGKSSSTADTPLAPTPTPITNSSFPDYVDKTPNKHQEPDSGIPPLRDEELSIPMFVKSPRQDDLIQRAKQLQLLDSVLAEESARRSKPLLEYPLLPGTRGHYHTSTQYSNRLSSVNGNLVATRPPVTSAIMKRSIASGALSTAPEIAGKEVVHAHGLGSTRHSMNDDGHAGLLRPSTALCTPTISNSVQSRTTQYGRTINPAHRNQLLAILCEGPGSKIAVDACNNPHQSREK
ncbi:hypothetical protein Clacol_003698 [Clathrus columnatus]|uniref:Nudix hydrolase domain-containing protein n=1 Tax=Clathrus columnatus TaxID=1419009 RepID=A0AAV5AC19_9AGAM|nr:hypothetical protein Clacol_003698 [Clathrus columnatus]